MYLSFDIETIIFGSLPQVSIVYSEGINRVWVRDINNFQKVIIEFIHDLVTALAHCRMPFTYNNLRMCTDLTRQSSQRMM